MDKRVLKKTVKQLSRRSPLTTSSKSQILFNERIKLCNGIENEDRANPKRGSSQEKITPFGH